MKNDQCQVFICSNTHWDREWHMPFCAFQARLINLLDTLIELLQRDPNYRVFNLDGQTICLEDYLDARPDRAAILRDSISAGRINVGPWYNLPDEFLTGDETLVRNLLVGRAIALSCGRVSRVGYLPDEFGHIAQMPQILNGFGIDSAIIWRGISSPTLPSEFIWEAPDGSAVLTHRINERVGYGIGWFGNWAIHSALGVNVPLEHFKDPAVKAHWCAELVKLFARSATTNVIYFPNGTDHTFPDPQLPDWLARVRTLLPNCSFHHASFDEYIAALRNATQSVPLTHVRGELRSVNVVPYQPDRPIPVNLVLNGVTSTRMDVKLAHHACEQHLLFGVEPLTAWASLLPAVPRDHAMFAVLRLAWRELLRNQPHDSICACSTDDVAADLLTRFRHCQQYADAARLEALSAIFAAHNITPAINPDKQAFALVHACQLPAPGGALVEFPLHASLAQSRRFAFADAAGRPIPAVLESLASHPVTHIKLGWYEAPCRSACVSLALPPRPGCSISALRVVNNASLPRRRWRTVARAELRNDALAISFSRDGRVHLHDRIRDVHYRDVISFDDGGDAGDTYTFSPPKRDTLLHLHPRISRIEYGGNTPVVRRVRLHGSLAVPASLNAKRSARSRSFVTIPLVLEFALWDDSDLLELHISLTNTARDHRLRCLIHTSAHTEHVWSEGHFDIQSRPHAMPSPPPSAWIEDAPTSFNNKRFVAACDASRGLAVITHGLQEHQFLPAHNGAIAITLLRCVGWLSLPNLRTRACNAGPSIPTPAAQMPGPFSCKLTITPCHDPALLPDIQRRAALANAQLLAVPIATQRLPKQPLSFISVSGAAVAALKPAEDHNGVILRLWNGSAAPTTASVSLSHFSFISAIRVRLDESPDPLAPAPSCSPHSLSLAIPPKSIASLRLCFS